MLQQVWSNYPADTVARAFVHHAQVAAAIYDCEGGDEFVREHKGLSFGVRKVCRSYYGDNDTGEEDPLDLTSLALRALSDAQGVVAEEIHDGVDIDSEATVATLKYAVPDMREHSIGEHLSFNALDMIAGDPRRVDYYRLPAESRERYDAFVEAYFAKCDERRTRRDTDARESS